MIARTMKDTTIKSAPNSKTGQKIPKGAAVKVTEKNGEWCTVEFSGQTGYIQTTHLDFEEYEPATKYIKVDKELLEKVYKTIGRMLGK